MKRVIIWFIFFSFFSENSICQSLELTEYFSFNTFDDVLSPDIEIHSINIDSNIAYVSMAAEIIAVDINAGKIIKHALIDSFSCYNTIINTSKRKLYFLGDNRHEASIQVWDLDSLSLDTVIVLYYESRNMIKEEISNSLLSGQMLSSDQIVVCDNFGTLLLLNTNDWQISHSIITDLTGWNIQCSKNQKLVYGISSYNSLLCYGINDLILVPTQTGFTKLNLTCQHLSISNDNTCALLDFYGDSALIFNLMEDRVETWLTHLLTGNLSSSAWCPSKGYLSVFYTGTTFTLFSIVNFYPQFNQTKGVSSDIFYSLSNPVFSADGERLIFNDDGGTVYFFKITGK